MSKGQNYYFEEEKEEHDSPKKEVLTTGRKPKFGKKRKQGKSSRPKKEDGRKTRVITEDRSGLSPIKLRGYLAYPKDGAPADVHIVNIDTYGFCCQLFERYGARALKSSGVAVSNLRYDMISSILCVIQQIVLGMTMGDSPRELVDSFPQITVVVPKTDLDLIYSCCIPRGRVFIRRSSESIAYLAATLEFLQGLKQTSGDQFYASLEGYLKLKGVCHYAVKPRQGEDSILLQDLTYVESTVEPSFVHSVFRALTYQMNAIHGEEEAYQAFSPVTCELTKVAYYEVQKDGSPSLITFNNVADKAVVTALLVEATTVRFYLGFVKRVRLERTYVTAEQVTTATQEAIRFPILQKYGQVQTRQYFDVSKLKRPWSEQGADEMLGQQSEFELPAEISPIEDRGRGDDNEWKAINVDHPVRKRLLEGGFTATRQELEELTGFTGLFWAKKSGVVVLHSLSQQLFVATVLVASKEDSSFKGSRCQGSWADDEFSQVRVVTETVTWRALISQIPYLNGEAPPSSPQASGLGGSN